jgi:hypothetical protein
VLKLEGFASRTKGAFAILSLLFTLGCAWLVAGCAHYHETTYNEFGAVESEVVSTVIGTGETTYLGVDKSYTTRDTGLSNNAVKAVEAGVTATPPGAAAGVFGGIISHEILE